MRLLVGFTLTMWVFPVVAKGPYGFEGDVLDMAPGSELVIHMGRGGSVKITGWERSALSLHPSAHGVGVSVNKSAKGWVVNQVPATTPGRHSRGTHDLEIMAPHHLKLKIDSVGGGLTLSDLRGEFSGMTAGGDLILNRINGRVKLETMGGEITLVDSDLNGSLTTMGGEILFENVAGDVIGRSMGGHVVYRNVRDAEGQIRAPEHLPQLDEMTPDSVLISTMGGDVRVNEAPEGAAIHTMGGNVWVQGASSFVCAKTMGGNMSITASDAWVDAVTMGGDIRLTLTSLSTADDHEILLTSYAGEILLRLPRDLPMDLELIIHYTRNSDQDFEIIAPFHLEQSHSAEWMTRGSVPRAHSRRDTWRNRRQDEGSERRITHYGTPRKEIRTVQSVFGGGIPIKVYTINGNIRIEWID